MNDGGYSRLEKDFLGNERMVHYDASGNMLGASDVQREADGTIRISNDQAPLTGETELPKVEAIVPEPKINNPEPQPVSIGGFGQKTNMPMNQVVMYCLAAFIATSLLTLGVMSVLRSNGPDASVRTTVQPTTRTMPQQNSDPVQEVQPDRENFPSDPRPRNDEDPPPFDQSAPDSNMDDSRPRIREDDPNAPTNEDSKPEPKPKKKGADEPIDLRGDEPSKADQPKKGDPGADPLRGDDIH